MEGRSWNYDVSGLARVGSKKYEKRNLEADCAGADFDSDCTGNDAGSDVVYVKR